MRHKLPRLIQTEDGHISLAVYADDHWTQHSAMMPPSEIDRNIDYYASVDDNGTWNLELAVQWKNDQERTVGPMLVDGAHVYPDRPGLFYVGTARPKITVLVSSAGSGGLEISPVFSYPTIDVKLPEQRGENGR